MVWNAVGARRTSRRTRRRTRDAWCGSTGEDVYADDASWGREPRAMDPGGCVGEVDDDVADGVSKGCFASRWVDRFSSHDVRIIVSVFFILGC